MDVIHQTYEGILNLLYSEALTLSPENTCLAKLEELLLLAWMTGAYYTRLVAVDKPMDQNNFSQAELLASLEILKSIQSKLIILKNNLNRV